MLYFFTGTDRDKARGAMNADVERAANLPAPSGARQAGKTHAEVLRITDANQADDLRAALSGPGMFGGARVLVLEGVLANEEMYPIFIEALPTLSDSEDAVFLYEEKLLADVRRKVEKYAERTVKHDLPGKGRDNSIFALASALARGDRKALWVGYQRSLARGERPEAIHGVLFWGAKKTLLSARSGSSEYRRGATLVSELAELPHKARRQGFELEYALEHYLLSVNKA
jgi:hypothetical protein